MSTAGGGQAAREEYSDFIPRGHETSAHRLQEVRPLNPLPHLMVADSLWTRLEWPLSQRPHLLLGAIAPDAYRVSREISYRYSHFRSRYTVGRRLRDFLEGILEPELREGTPESQAFRSGWLSHLVSDSVWRRMLRVEMPHLWDAGVHADPQERGGIRDLYQAAADRADRLLADAKAGQVAQIRWFLESAQPQYDCSPLTPVEVRRWAEAVLADHFPPPSRPVPYAEELDMGFVSRAIEAATEEGMALLESELRRAQVEQETASPTGPSLELE